MNKMQKWIVFWLIVVWANIICVLGFLNTMANKYYKEKKENWVSVDSEIVSVNLVKYRKSYITIGYKYDGEYYTGRIRRYYTKYTVGTHLELLVNPNDVEDVYLDESQETSIGVGYIMIGASVLCIIVGVYLVVINRSKKNEEKEELSR